MRCKDIDEQQDDQEVLFTPGTSKKWNKKERYIGQQVFLMVRKKSVVIIVEATKTP